MTELWRRSAIELAGLIARREASSAEVVEAHLARIDAVNPKLNAIVRVLADTARAGAAEADRKVAAGEPLGPLHGVPITVKENIDMAGLPTTNAVTALANVVAPLDAPVVERVRAAGAIPIGRTNLPDFAFRVHTDSSLHGLTRNPWNRDRTVAGSSGGDAAALASGMSAIGLGNDIGGSLRNPAGACGIASIRPSLGRVPSAASTNPADRPMAEQLMAVQGPMARRVADVRLGLQVLAGAHPRDPWALDVAFDGPAPPRPIRVAVVESPPGQSTDPTIAAATRAAADALANAGYDVRAEAPPAYADAVQLWATYLMSDLAQGLDEMAALMGEGGRTFLTHARQGIPTVSAGAAMSLLYGRRDAISRAWSEWMAATPLLLTPTWTQLPFEHGWDAASYENAMATLDIMSPVTPANLLGLPSACVPAGHDAASNLPIGVLVTGRRMREDLCLDAAEAIETRLPLPTPTPIDPAW
jgi:amidase